MHNRLIITLAATFILSLSSPAYAETIEPELTSYRVRLSTGIDMHFVAKGKLKKKKNAIIMLHGYSDSWRSFDEILKLLPIEELPVPVYALDMRGHGESSNSQSNSYTQDNFTDDLAAFMGKLKIKKALIIGHSMGSLIAHKFAIDYPDKVMGLVLLGSTTTMANHPVTLALMSDINNFNDNEPADPQFVIDFQASTFYNPIPWAIYRYVSESLRLKGIVWKETLNGLNVEDHTNQLSQIMAPTLIAWGDQDGVFSLSEQQQLNTLIPNSTLVIYPNAGHAVNVEKAEEIVEEIKDFVSNL
jgi:pimeloyl-ACP methyl ester carboxylesterase